MTKSLTFLRSSELQKKCFSDELTILLLGWHKNLQKTAVALIIRRVFKYSHRLCVNESCMEAEWKWGHEFRTWFISNQATTELKEGWLVSLINISKVELQVRYLSDYFHSTCEVPWGHFSIVLKSSLYHRHPRKRDDLKTSAHIHTTGSISNLEATKCIYRLNIY